MLRIILLFHNARPWLMRCVASIQRQSFRDWRCYAVDDLSSDGSDAIVSDMVRGDTRFTLIRNQTRLYHCGSTRRVLSDSSFDDEDIFIAVDGDDYLPDPFVFERVMCAYSDQVTWITWGSLIRTDGVPDFTGPVEDTALVRKGPWRSGHLRTWKMFLWRKIASKDFIGPDGEPLRVGADVASMYPMIEMAGNAHSKYLSSINYVYNRDNPLSNFRVRTAEQLGNGEFLRSKPCYPPLIASQDDYIRPTPDRTNSSIVNIAHFADHDQSKPFKVFGIGLPQTENSQLDMALWSLGFRTIADPPLLALVEALQKYDAATGESVAFSFRELDRRFPGSKFILTLCNQEAWLAAIQRRFDEKIFVPGWEQKMRSTLYGAHTWNRNTFRAAFTAHIATVREYFANRPNDLLVLDSAEADPNSKLQAFLRQESIVVSAMKK